MNESVEAVRRFFMYDHSVRPKVTGFRLA
jgi:hypothetical protein